MTISRVTQNMLSQRSLASLQTSLSRMARTQEQLSTGRVLNRPSDSPTDTTAAMRLRSSVSEQAQYVRNGQNGLGWLGQTDSTLRSMLEQVRRTRELAVQAAGASASSPESRASLAAEVEQLRGGLLSAANATYLDRPLFGGVTSGGTAYDAFGGFVGAPGTVVRSIADGSKVQVNVNGQDVFGPDGAALFDTLDSLASAIRTGDQGGIAAGQQALDAAMNRMTSALADVGTKYGRVERAIQTAEDLQLSLTTSLSEVENVDLPRAIVDLQMNQVAYQAALGATAKVVQPSLLDFLR